ncbi:MAG: hypothetical protein EZS28_007568 [Streblomastix strix]|uniref:Uncharacterized protein n=1 Tax=Streblomastix strix TaxID=222440 RepID=A0A5J4WQT2_9EUKA|nr:MAG: hypothetical protein EZS28_007568 [Streblomastix strix]
MLNTSSPSIRRITTCMESYIAQFGLQHTLIVEARRDKKISPKSCCINVNLRIDVMELFMIDCKVAGWMIQHVQNSTMLWRRIAFTLLSGDLDLWAEEQLSLHLDFDSLPVSEDFQPTAKCQGWTPVTILGTVVAVGEIIFQTDACLFECQTEGCGGRQIISDISLIGRNKLYIPTCWKCQQPMEEKRASQCIMPLQEILILPIPSQPLNACQGLQLSILMTPITLLLQGNLVGVVGCGDRIAANGIWMNIVDTSRAKDKESMLQYYTELYQEMDAIKQ